MEARRIVITGISRGLGQALVEGFIAAGHRLAGCARSAAAIQRANDRFGPPHRFDCVDLRDDAAVRQWAERVLAAGGVDLLINNAGVINRNAPLWEITDREFSEVVDINIKGTANVIRRFVPAMIARGTGVVVNFSSGWGRSASPEVAPYCAAKWAIEGLTRALAAELPRGIAAVPLNPGIIDTEMLRCCFGPSASAYPAAAQWARRAVPFLLGLSAKDNGQPLTVPG